jgi:hypothetical protein
MPENSHSWEVNAFDLIVPVSKLTESGDLGERNAAAS